MLEQIIKQLKTAILRLFLYWRYRYKTVTEGKIVKTGESDVIVGTTVAVKKKVSSTIRLLTKAPGFTDLNQSREKGQSDLSVFQVRIYIDPGSGVFPGQTIGVDF